MITYFVDDVSLLFIASFILFYANADAIYVLARCSALECYSYVLFGFFRVGKDVGLGILIVLVLIVPVPYFDHLPCSRYVVYDCSQLLDACHLLWLILCQIDCGIFSFVLFNFRLRIHYIGSE